MSLFDKLNKEDLLAKAKRATEAATDFAQKAADSAKTGISQVQATLEEKKGQQKLSKLPQEGGLQRYEVTYHGGHPDYPMNKEIKKYPYIIMDVMPDRFSFLPKEASKGWFSGFDILYSQVSSIDIVERTISTVESLLGSGSDNTDLRQKNVIEITYTDDSGDIFVLRNEMLTGFTVMGQARVCKEMMDLLRTNKILKLFGSDKPAEAITPVQPVTTVDVVEELKKFKELLDMGVITQEDFDLKKKQLLGI